MNFSPPKWGASHTEGRNIAKGLPKHLVKEVKKAVDSLVSDGLLVKAMKTGEWHYSLNPRKQKEIFKLAEME